MSKMKVTWQWSRPPCGVMPQGATPLSLPARRPHSLLQRRPKTVRYTLDNLPSKVLAREYRLALPDEKRLAEELEKAKSVYTPVRAASELGGIRMRIRRFAAALLLSLPVASSFAITYGEPDGNDHPFVGALVATSDGETYPYCSGTLIAPNVFLTAAHCDIGNSRVYVTFDSAYGANSKLYAGNYVANLEYTQSQNDPHDLAVVILKHPMNGLLPARLPALGQFDQVAKDQKFTAVGYGGQERTIQPGGPVIAYLDTREHAVSEFNSVGPGYLRLSQNNATGNGGTCIGDSGGPNFFGAGRSETNIIAGTTITGDSQCVSTNVIERLDTVASRRFLGGFVKLP